VAHLDNSNEFFSSFCGFVRSGSGLKPNLVGIATAFSKSEADHSQRQYIDLKEANEFLLQGSADCRRLSVCSPGTQPQVKILVG
jgi:hypothetical protein